MSDSQWYPTDNITPKNMPESIRRQLDVLRQVKKLLKQQIDSDRDTVAELLEKKSRIEKGGGK